MEKIKEIIIKANIKNNNQLLTKLFLIKKNGVIKIKKLNPKVIDKSLGLRGIKKIKGNL
jgi:hypothetical protein